MRAGPEIDYSKTTSSCFTSPPTPKALPLPPQICVSCVLKPYPSRCPVCLTSRLLWLRGRPSIRFIFSEHTSNPRCPFPSLYASYYICLHPGRTFPEPYPSHSTIRLASPAQQPDAQPTALPPAAPARHVFKPSCGHAAASVALRRPRDLLIRSRRTAKPAARQRRCPAASRQPYVPSHTPPDDGRAPLAVAVAPLSRPRPLTSRSQVLPHLRARRLAA